MRRVAFLSIILSAGLSGQQSDPFADLATVPTARQEKSTSSWTENLGFRKEILSQFGATEEGRPASRQSIGFEILKKFSTATSTVAAFNFQGRLVRRDRYNGATNDMEGENRAGWAAEYHNFYVDFYNVFNPLMGDAGRGRNVGRFNLRAGRFYVPFGLNLQTDTHGTVLQLSNDRNFGYERDWYTGFWGSISKHLNYDAYYLAGSGYDLKYKGQSGLAGVRVSLANRYLSEYGLEGGVSVLAGERLAGHHGVAPLETRRVGGDARVRRHAPGGLLTFTHELSGGRDARDSVSPSCTRPTICTRRDGGGSRRSSAASSRIGTAPIRRSSASSPGTSATMWGTRTRTGSSSTSSAGWSGRRGSRIRS